MESEECSASSSKPVMSTVIIDMVDDGLSINHSNLQSNKPAINVCLETELSESELEIMSCDGDISIDQLKHRTKLRDILPQQPPFQCPFEQCRKIFQDRLQLQKHYRNHQERRHKCQFCGQKFLYLKDKRIHERTHTGERPYVCHVCDKAFVQKCTLANHLITHKKGVKGEVCDVCGRAYSYKKSLAQHKKEKHSRQSGEQFYSCSKCDRKYMGLYRYNLHVAKCKGKNAFSCEDCGVGFERKANLHLHRESCPYRSQVFQCGVCNIVVDSERTLRVHMLQLHRIGFDDCIKVQVIKEDASEISSSTSDQNQASLLLNGVKNFTSTELTIVNDPLHG